MEKKYTIGIVTGIILLVLVSAYQTLYNSDYEKILENNPDQNLFLLSFESGKKVEVLSRTSFDDCPYGVLRIADDKITIKCGWSIAGVYSSWTEYWRTYGKNLEGEEAWWERNNRKKSLVDLSYEINQDSILVKRTTPFYKGRSGTDGELIEDFIIYQDGIKLTSNYYPENNAKHMIVYREDESSSNILFDPTDPLGNFLDIEKDVNGKNLFLYGGKSGDLEVDPIISLISPDDKLSTNLTGSVVHLISNCSSLGNQQGDAPKNITFELFYNSSQGWNRTGAVLENAATDTNQSIYYDYSLTLPSYVDTFPYLWRSTCCINGTSRDNCQTSSIRAIAANIQPSIGKPMINSSLRTDEALSCWIDGSLITTRSRANKFSYADNLTNGVVNITYIIYNATANLSYVPNVRNLTYTWTRENDFNLTRSDNVWCRIQAWDGFQNSSFSQTTNSTPTNVSDGKPWDLNITWDYDINFIQGTSNSKMFNITWEGPISPGDRQQTYVTTILQEPNQGLIYNLSYQEFNSNSNTGFNYTTYDNTNSTIDNIHSGSIAEGRYLINITACDGNYSYGGYTGQGNCVTDISENYIDFFSYSVSFGPAVSYFRVNPPGTGSKDDLIPAGQTDDIGIFKVNVSGLGELNFTLKVNQTLNSCVELYCSPNNTISNTTHYRGEGYNYNITNVSATGMLNNWGTYSHYFWCSMDYNSCPVGTIENMKFVFDFDPGFHT
jgi:hypothetical protein